MNGARLIGKWLALSLLLTFAHPAWGTPPERSPRRVYVLHSGLHTIFSHPWPNLIADSLRTSLLLAGVPEQNIVVLDNPYPTASWGNMFPRQALDIFLDSMAPTTKTAQEAYVRLHKALASRNVGPQDEVIWVGHSAGGQMGITMAYLARSLDRFPELARAVSPYQFVMVVTLGSPVGANPLSADVKLRHYYSSMDKVVRWASLYGTFALRCMGYKVNIEEIPPRMQPGSAVRVFQGVEHPFWDEARVVNRILAEFEPGYRPGWQQVPWTSSIGPGLAALLAQALERETGLSLEDPPK